jgi:hypothetical protein
VWHRVALSEMRQKKVRKCAASSMVPVTLGRRAIIDVLHLLVAIRYKV